MNMDTDIKRLKSCCAILSEHFDTVHIFVTRGNEEGTVTCQYGEGNWFTRYGQVKIWILKEEAAETKNEE